MANIYFDYFYIFGLNDIFEMPFYIRDVSVFLRYIRIRIRWISVISANDFCPKPLSFDNKVLPRLFGTREYYCSFNIFRESGRTHKSR